MPTSLLVPSAVAAGIAGNATSNVGSRIRPPPPTIASTPPAPAAAANRLAPCVMSMPGTLTIADHIAITPKACGIRAVRPTERATAGRTTTTPHAAAYRAAHAYV